MSLHQVVLEAAKRKSFESETRQQEENRKPMDVAKDCKTVTEDDIALSDELKFADDSDDRPASAGGSRTPPKIWISKSMSMEHDLD